MPRSMRASTTSGVTSRRRSASSPPAARIGRNSRARARYSCRRLSAPRASNVSISVASMPGAGLCCGPFWRHRGDLKTVERAWPRRAFRLSRGDGSQFVEALRQIGDQILRVFQADMDAHQRPLGLPAGRGAAAFREGRLDQALVAAPAGADAEQVERVDEGVDRFFRDRFQYEAEQPAGAEEIALPELVAGVLR